MLPLLQLLLLLLVGVSCFLSLRSFSQRKRDRRPLEATAVESTQQTVAPEPVAPGPLGRHTICFHDNHAGDRGTSVALYDYADFNEKILGYKSLV
jgi:hypothetical protein